MILHYHGSKPLHDLASVSCKCILQDPAKIFYKILQDIFTWALLSVMSSAADLAKRLNSWAREGLDMMGGADGEEIRDLITTFMTSEEDESLPQECKSLKTQPLHS